MTPVPPALGAQWLALAEHALAPANVHGNYARLNGQAYGPFVCYRDLSPQPARAARVSETGLAQARTAISRLLAPTPDVVRQARAQVSPPGEPDPLERYVRDVLAALVFDLVRLPGDPGGHLGAYAVTLLRGVGAPPGAVEQFLGAWTAATAGIVAATALLASTPGSAMPALNLGADQWRRAFFGDAAVTATGVGEEVSFPMWAGDASARAALERRIAAVAE